MSDFEPRGFDGDPVANALLNIAEQIHRLARATNDLLYALKYSKAEGLSLAEAVEKFGQVIASSVNEGGETIAKAIDRAG